MAKYLYKLTDQEGYTRKGQGDQCLWGPGVRHSVKVRVKNPQLCTANVIHAYSNPLIAVIMNPRHANFKNPRLWKATGFPVVRESQLKLGCYSLTTVEEIPIPVITVDQKVRFTILVSLEVYKEADFVSWAKNWLDGTNRTATVVHGAFVANATYGAHAANAAYGAHAAYAAYSAHAAFVANATYGANTVANAANATYAAYTAYATQGATHVKINFIKLLNKAIREEPA